HSQIALMFCKRYLERQHPHASILVEKSIAVLYYSGSPPLRDNTIFLEMLFSPFDTTELCILVPDNKILKAVPQFRTEKEE
ncbi:hypothetical protein ACQP3F_33305, partial [Escherichia coli]